MNFLFLYSYEGYIIKDFFIHLNLLYFKYFANFQSNMIQTLIIINLYFDFDHLVPNQSQDYILHYLRNLHSLI
jgi:hypothetical protein